MERSDRSVVEFTIPYPKNKSAFAKRFGLNAYWAGKHPQARAKDARDIHELVYYALYNQRIDKKLFEKPVSITFYWMDNLDVDNHAALGKMFVDALKGWLLHDDSKRWYRRCIHDYHDEDVILVHIEEV